MGSLRLWVLLLVGQIATLAVLALLGSTTAATPALRYLGYVCIAGIFLSIPPLVIKLFVNAQLRIGNDGHPFVHVLQQHEAWVVLGVWAMIGTALGMALPRIMSDIRAEQLAAQGVAVPVDAAAASPEFEEPVTDVVMTTPAADSPELAAILDPLLQRFKPADGFRVDHVRVANGWAFVRATEVVKLDGGEEQETDLTVAALLELPADSPNGWWRIVDYWALPENDARPLAEFRERVRARLRQLQLPRALLPEDL